jgi:hypothetical protein
VSLVGIVRDAYVGCAPDASVPMSAVRLRLFGYVVAAWRGADLSCRLASPMLASDWPLASGGSPPGVRRGPSRHDVNNSLITAH